MQFTVNNLQSVVFDNAPIALSEEQEQSIVRSYDFLREFASDKVIYGINTGFGPMAQWRVDDRNLTDLQYNIIRSHSTGAGAPLDSLYVRAAMVARLASLAKGKSGIHLDAAHLLVGFLNNNIIPYIPEHGSVGASGDLVQLAHLALCLIGEGEVLYQGQWQPSAQVMQQCGLRPLEIHIREGLSLTNGTSVMTGISIVNLHRASKLIYNALVASVWINEIAQSYDDFMSEPLNAARPHGGQDFIARHMRQYAADSRLLRKREHELYDRKHEETTFEHKVQPYYSLRCIPQILGPVFDTLCFAQNVVNDELNSASDNPIVDPDTSNVYHGGNFHGDYISLEADKVKIAVTRIAQTAERQLNYLCHDRINGILPPFLNMGTLGLNYGLQASQFTATSTTAECQTLSMPNYVHTIPNNNDNQDIVSMGTNSALICAKVIDNAYQVMAVLYLALAQATDCLNVSEKLASETRDAYHSVRRLSEKIVDDRPLYHDIERIVNMLKSFE